MGRKKKEINKEEEELEIFEDDNNDDNSDDSYYHSDKYNDFSDENIATNALQYASIVSTPSKTATQFKHVPKETRYTFLDKEEVRDIKHWDKNYRNYMYMKKVLMLQAKEDDDILDNRLRLYQIKNESDLKEYCKKNNMLISYNMIKHNKELINELIKHIGTLQESGFYEDIKNQNKMIKDIYLNYRESNKMESFVDDLGMTGNIFATSIVAMGREGNERHAQVTTISATKEIDSKKEQEQKTDYKNKIGGFIRRFN